MALPSRSYMAARAALNQQGISTEQPLGGKMAVFNGQGPIVDFSSRYESV
jgi:hypothetical protein